jgi:N-acetylglucosaminyldiphosphoundecaprenol N-acetyl-beta-D-mannosaminyltransferase
MRSRFRDGASVNVLGVRVDPTNMDEAVVRVVRWAGMENQHCRYVCVSGMHGLVEAQSDDGLRNILNAAHLNVPDGMPLSWLGWFAGFGTMERVFGPDLMVEVCAKSVDAGVSHFFYGGNDGVAEDLAKRFSVRFPGLKVAGTYCPPFRMLTESERRQVVAMINESGAHIVWVGLSTPNQEKWMSEFAPLLHARVVLGVGAAFDYNTGRLRRAPKWMQECGLEWLYRLMQEPQRLAKRYFSGIPRFSLGVLQQACGSQSASLEHTKQ